MHKYIYIFILLSESGIFSDFDSNSIDVSNSDSDSSQNLRLRNPGLHPLSPGEFRACLRRMQCSKSFNSLTPLRKGREGAFMENVAHVPDKRSGGVLEKVIQESLKWTVPNYSPSNVKHPETSPPSSSLKIVI